MHKITKIKKQKNTGTITFNHYFIYLQKKAGYSEIKKKNNPKT